MSDNWAGRIKVNTDMYLFETQHEYRQAYDEMKDALSHDGGWMRALLEGHPTEVYISRSTQVVATVNADRQ